LDAKNGFSPGGLPGFFVEKPGSKGEKMKNGETLRLCNGDLLRRAPYGLIVQLRQRRSVLSTAASNGGLREDLQTVFNCDSSEDRQIPCEMKASTYEKHMQIVARELGLDPDSSAGLCTSAQMDNAVLELREHEGVKVQALVTGGIDVNGGRAGDAAQWLERQGQFLPLLEGTINILLFISCSLTPGALARAMITATEAKTAAIQELLLPSCYSSGLATGSGTDGMIVICNPPAKGALTDAGKHSKLGELIGCAVKAAVKKALFLQTGDGPDSQHSALKRMGRYGVCWEDFEGQGQTCRQKISDFERTGEAVCAASLCAHLLDQEAWGLISGQEALRAAEKLLEQPRGEETNPKQCIAGMFRAYLLQGAGIL
jgi:adenosylcobinamide hydrolase